MHTYTDIHIQTYIYRHTYTDIHIQAYIYIQTDTDTYTYTYICIRIHAYTYTYIYIHIHVHSTTYILVCMYVCMYIYHQENSFLFKSLKNFKTFRSEHNDKILITLILSHIFITEISAKNVLNVNCSSFRIGKGRGYKANELTTFSEGQTLCVGGKQVEVSLTFFVPIMLWYFYQQISNSTIPARA